MTTLYRAFASVLFAACYLGGAFAGSAHPQSSDPLPHVDLSANSELRTTTVEKDFCSSLVWKTQNKAWIGVSSSSCPLLSKVSSARFGAPQRNRRVKNFSDPFLQGYFNAFGNLHGTMATLSSLTTLDIPCKERYPAVSGPTTIAHIATFNIRRMQLGDAVLGLTSMKGRLKLVHGKLSVLSQGTVVRATEPLPLPHKSQECRVANGFVR